MVIPFDATSNVVRPWVLVLVASSLVSALATSKDAQAHPGIGAPSAYPTVPSSVGTVVSSTFTITWLDFNRPIPTGTATIDWYYATQNPRTYLIGALPEDLAGEHIVGGIAESDPSNEYVWDVSLVPSGSYFIWSKVTEPPEEAPVLQLYSFSQGVVTVQHPGDPVHPAVCFNKPDNPFTLVDEQLDMVLEVFDPDGTGRLRLELFPRDAPDEVEIVFDDRPAEARLEYALDASVLAEGDYGFRFTITDGRGLSFTAYTRWFVRVTHRLAEPDGGLPDQDLDGGAATPDAGPRSDLGSVDLGGGEPDPEGCGCTTAPTPRSTRWPLLLGLVFFALARLPGAARRVSDARRGPLR